MSTPFNRREALASFASLLAASPLLKAQEAPRLIGEPPGRIAPYEDLANALEFEPMAQRKLNEATYAAIADGPRGILDRITFRPRQMVNTKAIDLTVDLFGQPQFTPLLVGPAAHQGSFHPEGELATARGAAAAQATLIVADRSDHPIEEIAAASEGNLWFQVYPESDSAALIGRIRAAIAAGCRAVCLTIGTPYEAGRLTNLGDPSFNWEAVDRIRQGIDAPLVLKGVMSPNDAEQAVEHGANAIVVSNHGGLIPGLAEPLAVLPSVASVVYGRIPVLVDGGIRRGGDVLKALAMGASAALIARPALWALAAYGADGVQTIVELLQTELGRDMTMLGTVNPAAVTPAHIRVHRR